MWVAPFAIEECLGPKRGNMLRTFSYIRRDFQYVWVRRHKKQANLLHLGERMFRTASAAASRRNGRRKSYVESVESLDESIIRPAKKSSQMCLGHQCNELWKHLKPLAVNESNDRAWIKDDKLVKF